MKQSSPLQELIAYRSKYLNRDEKKINREFLTMIDRSIEYIQELEQKCHREERIQLCYGIDQRLLYKVLELPDVVFSKFIDYVEKNELYVEEAEELIHDILYWERRTQETIDEYYSLKNDKTVIAEILSKDPLSREDVVFREVENLIEERVREFQCRTRLVVSVSPYNEELDEERKLTLRNKYLKYLFEKYDKRRNRQTP